MASVLPWTRSPGLTSKPGPWSTVPCALVDTPQLATTRRGAPPSAATIVARRRGAPGSRRRSGHRVGSWSGLADLERSGPQPGSRGVERWRPLALPRLEQAGSGEPVGLNATAHPREAHHGVPGRVRRQRAGRSPGRRGRGAHAGRGRGRGRPGPSGAPRPTVGDIRCRRARPGPSACTGPRTGTSSTRCSALCHSATGCERRSRRSNPTRTTRCAWASSASGCPSRG